jgi:hypothetical protein
MKIAIMQPYFLPYIGYFQLIDSVDKFVIYDNIEFTRKGWINRNRMLVNGKDEFITLPLKKDSDFLNVNQRQLADTFNEDRQKLIRKIMECYRKSPQFDAVFPLVEGIFNYTDKNLFSFIYNSVITVCNFLDIKTPITISSGVSIDHHLKSEQKVIAIAKEMKACTYINAIGGIELYSKDTFQQEGIDLQFIKSDTIAYKQFGSDFVPWLSILDVMMFNSVNEIKSFLNSYTLVKP